MKKTAALILVAASLLGMGAECSTEQAKKKAAPAAPAPLNYDNGVHEFSGFGRFKYDTALYPSASAYSTCRWRIEARDNKTKKWYTVEKGGQSEFVYAEDDGRPKRVWVSGCGKFHK